MGLDFITKGLELKGVVGYESRHQSGIFGSQDYARYIKDVNNPYELSFIPYGGWTDTALALNKGSNYRYFLNFNGFLNYSRTFNKKHSVEGFLNFFAQNIIREEEEFNYYLMIIYLLIYMENMDMIIVTLSN